jgi:hypothetical protein
MLKEGIYLGGSVIGQGLHHPVERTPPAPSQHSKRRFPARD